MPVQKLPVVSLDDENHRRRTRETINQVLDHTFDDSRRQTDAEKLAGVTPVNKAFPPGDVRRYGLSTSATAAQNSAAIQSASLVAWTAGGGVIYIPAGTYSIDTPPLIYETVSVWGDAKNSTILKKTTNTPSTVTDSTVNVWDSTIIGQPVCVLHFVSKSLTGPWSYAECRNIQVQGDTSSPNSTAVRFGFFFQGCIGTKVTHCFAQFVSYGYFVGAGSMITSDFSGNNAGNTQFGFYIHFATSASIHHNYANKFRYSGYFVSAYYSEMFCNAADNVGAPWKVGTGEISLAYWLNGWKGGSFRDNGCETHNGPVWKFTNNISTSIDNNLALDITSSYTGGSDICLMEIDSDNSCRYYGNRAQTTSMTGTGARHFMWKVATLLGDYHFDENNRFVDTVSDTTDTSVWANTSGTLVKKTALVKASGSFTPTVFGGTTAGTTTYGTRTGYYERNGNVISFLIRVTWTAQTGSGNLRIGDLPVTSSNTEVQPVSVMADSLTFGGQLSAGVVPNTTYIELYNNSTGAALANIAIDTAATVWLSGSYQV